MNFKWALDDCKAVDRQQASCSQIITSEKCEGYTMTAMDMSSKL